MPGTPTRPGPRTPRGVAVGDLPSQGWDAWWHWHRNEILLPEHRPPVDPQDRARSQLSSLLIAQSRSTHATVRAAAVRALGRVAGDEAVPHLLARLRDPRGIDPLIAALRDEDAGVRAAAARALAQLGNR